MTEKEIEEFFCEHITSMGFVAVRSVNAQQAPTGTYLSVGVTGVRLYGVLHERPARTPETLGLRLHQYNMSLVIWEIEGDGEAIRKVLRSFDKSDFRAKMRDIGVSLFVPGPIVDMSSVDGSLWIRQKRMEVPGMFSDAEQGEKMTMQSVTGAGVSSTGSDVNFNVGEM